jgi:hypothetical protein
MTNKFYSRKPAAATVFEDVVVLVEVTVYNPSRRCGLKTVKMQSMNFIGLKEADK